MDPKMVLDSVASNNVSFPENHAFYTPVFRQDVLWYGAVRPSGQFAADDILLYEFCYYNPMDLLHHLEKGKEELSPLQYHIKSLHIISRHYKKSLLRS